MTTEPKERLDEDGNLERRCSKCGDWWPADREFFYSSGPAEKGKLHSQCKACYDADRRERREKKALQQTASGPAGRHRQRRPTGWAVVAA